MEFFCIEPQHAGVEGSHTVKTRSGSYLLVEKLHYEFQFFPEDDAVYAATHTCMVTEDLGRAFVKAGLTGLSLEEPFKISVSEEHRRSFWKKPAIDMPKFLWLRFTGEGFIDDFGSPDELRFVVSARALKIFQSFKMKHLKVVPLPDKKLPPLPPIGLDDLLRMKEESNKRHGIT